MKPFAPALGDWYERLAGADARGGCVSTRPRGGVPGVAGDGAELGVSKDAVHRVWKEAGLKPHRLERYMASDDPDFEAKAADIIGLYLNPPQHATVFCVDEKTAIQALDRLDPVLPLAPGRAERHGFEYYRH